MTPQISLREGLPPLYAQGQGQPCYSGNVCEKCGPLIPRYVKYLLPKKTQQPRSCESRFLLPPSQVCVCMSACLSLSLSLSASSACARTSSSLPAAPGAWLCKRQGLSFPLGGGLDGAERRRRRRSCWAAGWRAAWGCEPAGQRPGPAPAMPGKAQHFQGPQVSCCTKYLLFASNVLFWLLGAAFLAIGLWAWAEKGVLSNLSSITDLGGFDPVWLFLVVGGVMFVLGFAGCIGALRENTFLLKFFSVFLGLIFFLELTAGVLAFIFKDWIKDQLNFFINNNVKAYRDDIDLQNLIDFAQEYWSCCGAHGPNDWNLNIYFNCTDSNPSRERCGVPFSCCVKDPAEDVLNTQCGYDVRLKLELEQQSFIHTKGCAGQFEKWLQDNLIVVAGTFVGVALLQIFGICMAQNLVSDINAVKANW
uniref:Tetraspanin 17 n=2 Tax=Podarcis TaxID=42163 RepID=A0A670IL26_PODMU